jgi:hypothetical protein
VVEVEVERTIHCAPETFLEFVMDPERYQEVDDKIVRVLWKRREENLTEFKFKPRIPGMRLPEPPAVSQMRLTPGKRIDVRLAPPPQNRLNHFMATFRASWACAQDGDRTRVRRWVSFDFNPVVRWFFEPVLRRTLPRSVERELALAQQILER